MKVYFEKGKDISVDDAVGKIVYLEVRSWLHYGCYSFRYYAKIIKTTPKFFVYCDFTDAKINWCKEETFNKVLNYPNWVSSRLAKDKIIELKEVSIRKGE